MDFYGLREVIYRFEFRGWLARVQKRRVDQQEGCQTIHPRIWLKMVDFFLGCLTLLGTLDGGEYLANLALNAKILGIGFNQWD